MAHQINSEFEGTVGNLIFYEQYGQFLIRTVQVQAPGSRISAKNFGIASSAAKRIRTLLATVIPNSKDKEMQNRLTTATQRFLASLNGSESFNPNDNPLTGFRFLESSALSQCLRFPLTLIGLPDGNIRFEIPEINSLEAVAAPEGATRLELKVMTVSFNPENKYSFAGTPVIISMPFIDAIQPASSTVLRTRARSGCIVLVAVAITFWKNTRQINKTGFMPVEIVAAFR
jgi:hypothetical protein